MKEQNSVSPTSRGESSTSGSYAWRIHIHGGLAGLLLTWIKYRIWFYFSSLQAFGQDWSGLPRERNLFWRELAEGGETGKWIWQGKKLAVVPTIPNQKTRQMQTYLKDNGTTYTTSMPTQKTRRPHSSLSAACPTGTRRRTQGLCLAWFFKGWALRPAHGVTVTVEKTASSKQAGNSRGKWPVQKARTWAACRLSTWSSSSSIYLHTWEREGAS